MVPLLWLAVFYLPLSIIIVKAPWYTYLAMPAVAIVAGFGMVELINLVQLKGDGRVKSHLLTAETQRRREKLYESNMFFTASQRHSGRFLVFNNSSKVIRSLLSFGLIVSLVFVIYNLDSVSFIKRVSGITGLEDFQKVQGKNWNEMLEKKKLWSRLMSDKGKVAFLEHKPIIYYLTGIDYDDVFILNAGYLMSLDKRGLVNLMKDNGIGAFVINAESLTSSEENLKDMTSLWGVPEKIGPLLVFLNNLNFEKVPEYQE